MTDISDTFRDPTGSGVGGVVVRASLVAASEVVSGGGAIIREAQTTTAADGTWTLTLTPISDLAVSGGAYYIIEADGHRWTIDVPDSGTFTLDEVQVEPGPLPPTWTASGDALQRADNLSDLPDPAAAREHLGLGTAAQAAADDFDAVGTAASAASAAVTAAVEAAATSAAGLYLALLGGTLAGALAMGGHKITGGAAGTAGTDFALVSQLPAIPGSLPPSGSAGGDLIGSSYPNPTVSATTNFLAQVVKARLDQMAAPTASVTFNGQKATLLGNGSDPTDAAAFGQIPTPGAVTALSTFGVASANGNATTYARSNHVHGAPDAYTWDSPAQRGWAEWNMPPSVGVAVSQNFTSGTVYGVSFIAQSAKTASKVAVQVVSSAGTPTSGENLIGLYSVTGTTATELTTTADLGTWGAAGLQPYALGSSETFVPGTTYIVLFLSVAGTAVHLQGITSDTAAQIGFLNLGLSNTAAPWLKFFVYATGQTALPSSFTISGTTMSPTNALAPFVCFIP